MTAVMQDLDHPAVRGGGEWILGALLLAALLVLGAGTVLVLGALSATPLDPTALEIPALFFP